MKILVVVDMQNDFIDGALGTKEAQEIIDNVVKEIGDDTYDRIYTTQDTHFDNYLETNEGKNLPVVHCIKGTKGWEIADKVKNALASTNKEVENYEKLTFGSIDLAKRILQDESKEAKNSSKLEVVMVGLCTDICVVSNALLVKAYCLEIELSVKASCCAGVTPKTHQSALETMKMCQVRVI